MNKYINIHTVWALLMMLTLATWTTGILTLNGSMVVSLIMLSVIIKGWLIIRDFMGLKGVSLLWRAIMYGWLWVVCLGILIFYLVS